MISILENEAFLCFAFLTAVSVGPVVAHYWHKARRDDLEAALKQDMLQRGFTADDIVKVLEAGRGKPSCRRAAPRSGWAELKADGVS